jgi:precorrin-3B synthase
VPAPAAVHRVDPTQPLPALPAVRDACPSAHEPFVQLDGALVRVRVPGGGWRAGALSRVAAAASVHGSGLEITNRANLQIRGLTPDSHRLLARELVESGVAPADAGADARRNVLASPTAGFDPGEVADTRPLVAGVAAALAGTVGLSAKFGVIVDGGGRIHVRGRRHDICLGAVRRRDGSVGYQVRLAAALPRAAHLRSDHLVDPDDALDLVAGALELVADHVDAKGRMAGVVAALGEHEALRQAAERGGVPLTKALAKGMCPLPESSVRPIGVLPQRQAGLSMLGAMPVLGRLTAAQCGAIAAVASDLSNSTDDAEVRLTPWRSVVIPNVPTEEAGAALAELEALDLAVSPSDPALSVVACAGSSGCPASYTDTQWDGRAVVSALRARSARSFSVHLSGCAKRCADSATDFDLTLIGGPTPGAYHVVGSRDGGSPSPSGVRVEAADVPDHVASMARVGHE